MSDKIEEIRERHTSETGPRRYELKAQIHDDRAFLLAEVDRQRAEIERLREALRWYADQENHFPVHVHHRRAGYPDPVAVFVKEPPIMDDCGRRARAALEGEA